MGLQLVGSRKSSGSVMAFVCACAAFATPVSAQEYAYAVPADAGDGLTTASLADKGLETESFVRLMNRPLEIDRHLIHSILVVKDGALVFEAYFEGGDVDLFDENLLRTGELELVQQEFTRDDLHYTASVSKSVTSLAFGIALDQGYVPGVDTPIFSFFPEYDRFRTAEKDSITIRHLLTMTAGLAFDEDSYPIADPRNDAYQLFMNDDPIGFVFGKEVIDTPGSTYRYSSGTTLLLGELISRTTGQSLPSFVEEHLFGPLEIFEYSWAPCKGDADVYHAAGGLYIRPRDMAKIGQLVLQDGVWNGRRVLSTDWVRQSTSNAVAVPFGGTSHAYGYHWKLGRFGGLDAFYAAGWGGQYIVVLPDADMVFVQTAGGYTGERIPLTFDDILSDYVIPATGYWSGEDSVQS